MTQSNNKNANYRKYNDRTISSGKYHKLDDVNIRAKIKEETRKEVKNEYIRNTDSSV